MASLVIQLAVYAAGAMLSAVVVNLISQLFLPKSDEPPVVPHWVPFIGNAVAYGMDPYNFLVRCQKKYGDIFTFVLLGRKMTCYLGVEGNEFILNGKLQDVNAEEIYGPLTIPVFGSDVVYDCPNSKFMEQKKFVKFGLTQKALESHVQLIEGEVLDYIKSAPAFGPQSGTVDIASVMSEITIFTAARALQGEEVRRKLTTEFASLYHDLDSGFSPINFLLPWAPLPHNRKRDAAHSRMRAIYMDIIEERRRTGTEQGGSDMIWNLMRCTYKDGRAIPDKEIAHMMITLLMAGQHTSSSASTWIMLHLASKPDVAEQLYEEQLRNLGHDGRHLPPLQYADLEKLPLLRDVVKETLRVNSAIHSLMRKVKNPLRVPGTPYVVHPDKVLLASPLVTALSEEYFPNAKEWDPHRWGRRAEEEAAAAAGGEDNDIVDYGYGAVSKGTKSPYLPFGAGRHRCIGEKFAYVNLGVIVATMVRYFRVRTLDGGKADPATDYSSLFSRPMQPSMIRWERRVSE